MNTSAFHRRLRSTLLFVIATLLFDPSPVSSQALDGALRWSPDGMCLFVGNLLTKQAVPPIDAYIVQRDDGAGFVPVGRLERPQSRNAFEARAGSSTLAEIKRLKSLRDDNAAWEFVRTHGNPDDYGFLALDLRFQRALGTLYIDETVKNRQAGTKLSYRLLAVRGADTDKTGLSGSAIAGMVPRYPAPRLVRSHSTDSSVEATWSIRPVTDGPMWGDVLLQRGGRGPFEKTPGRMMAGRQGDSIVFHLNLRIESENLYRICVLPRDFTGNPGPVSDTAILLTVSAERSPGVEELVAADSADGITLRWKPLPPKPWYTAIEISRSKDPEKNYTQIATIPATASEYLDPSVLPDKVYYYRLSIVTATGGVTKIAGSISSPHRNTTRAPLSPNGLTAEAEGTGVRLRWLPVVTSDLFAYFVYRGTSLSDSMQQISPALKETSFLDTAATLSGRLTYAYVVRAVNSDQMMSVPSVTAFARPVRSSPPSAVLGLSAFHSGSRVQLSWPDMTRVDGGIAEYRVYRRGAGPKAPTYAEKHFSIEGKRSAKELGFELLATSREPHFDDTTPPQTDVLYTVSCVDITGAEGPIAPPAAASAPRAPKASPALLGARATASGIEVLWHRVPDASVSGYALYRRLPNEDAPARIATANKNASAYVDATAKPGVLYFYSVAAVTSADESPRSREKGAQR